LPEALRIARQVGYNGVELRHVDFLRCRQAGMTDAGTEQLVRDAGLPVAVIGTENGVLFDSGAELDRLLDSLRYVCERAVALDCGVIMTTPGNFVEGAPAALPAKNLRIAADIADGHGLRLALEFNSRHPALSNLPAALEVVDAADRRNCGLLVDTYHLHRSGGTAESLARLPVERIVTFQFSDVPPTPPSAAPVATDRLPPGRGTVPFVEIFRTLAAMGYAGWLSYEAPHPDQWRRPAETVAREGVEQARALMGRATPGPGERSRG